MGISPGIGGDHGQVAGWVEAEFSADFLQTNMKKYIFKTNLLGRNFLMVTMYFKSHRANSVYAVYRSICMHYNWIETNTGKKQK